MKNVFDFRKELIGEYARFSTSFAKPSAEDIGALLKKEYGSGRYWREPLIQINPNYEKDQTVDELHTYRGRQGSDVAMLVRRLRAQLNADNLLCIGTSATMAGVGQAGDKRKAIADHREGRADALAVARALPSLPGVQGRQFGERKGREPAGRHLGRRRFLKER